MNTKQPIVYFFLIACVFSWLVWIPLALSRAGIIPLKIPMPLYFLGAFGPMLGALLSSRKFGVSSPGNLLKKLFQFQGAWRWYIIALLLPFAIYSISALLVYAGYHEVASFEFNSPLGVLSALFSMLLIVVGEELGWRGFAQPYLQNSKSAFDATIYVWLMWGIWHFPAFFVSGIFESLTTLLLAFLGFMVLLFPFSLLFTWLINSSKGQTMLAVLLHAAVAAASGTTNIAMVKPIPFFTTFTFVFLIVGGLLLWYYGRENLARVHRATLST